MRDDSPRKRILELLKTYEYELFPNQIAIKLGLNPSTTRYYLRDLLQKGEIIQPYRGAYCSQITYGMIRVPLRVHNLILSCEALWLLEKMKIFDRKETTEDVLIWVQFGKERGKITIRICSDRTGMDRNTLAFAVYRAYDMVEESTGHKVENVIVRTWEANRDHQGVKLDSVVQSFTREAFDDFLDRVYQKTENTVRVETKISKEMKVEEVLRLLQTGGGIPSFEVVQSVAYLKTGLNSLIEVLKEVVLTQNRLNENNSAIFVALRNLKVAIENVILPQGASPLDNGFKLKDAKYIV